MTTPAIPATPATPGTGGGNVAATFPTSDAGSAAQQDDLAQFSLNGSASASYDSLAWTLISAPAESSKTTGDIVDPTTTTPDFTPDVVGDYVFKCTTTKTDGGGSGVDTTDDADITVTVGREGWLRVADYDMTAGASQDVKTGGDGNYTVDGVTLAISGTAGSTSCTVGGGDGLKSVVAGNGNAVLATVAMDDAWTGYTDIGQDLLVMFHRVAGGMNTAEHNEGCGWKRSVGNIEMKQDTRYVAGAVTTRPQSNTGAWATGSGIATDPEVVAFLRVDHLTRTYIKASWGTDWPDFSQLTETGRLSILRTAANADDHTVVDNIKYVAECWATAVAFTSELLGISVWTR